MMLILGDKAELGPAALGVVLRFAAVLLVRCLKSAQAAHFLENTLGIKLVFQPLERAIHWLTFANEYFWHQLFNSNPSKFSAQQGDADLNRGRQFRQIDRLTHQRIGGVGFWVISFRRVLVPSPRARVHQRTMGEAMKIDE